MSVINKKINIQHCILLSAFLFCINFYNTVSAITLDEAVERAMQNNPTITAEQEKININDAEIKKASLRLNPKIILEATTADKSYNGYIEQTFETGGKRKQRTKIAKIEKDIAVSKIIEEIINVRKTISENYISHYCNILRLEKAEQFYSDAKTLLKISKEQNKQEKSKETEEAEIYVLKCLNRLNIAKSNYNRSFNNLNYLMGDSLKKDEKIEKPNIKTEFTPDIESTDIEYAILKAFENRPEIKYTEKTIEKAQEQKKLARLTAIPNTIISAGPNIAAPKEKVVGVFTAIGMEIPVFNRGQADLKLAESIKNYNEKQLIVQKNKIKAEIHNICTSIIQTYTSLNLYENEILPKSMLFYQKNKEDFRKGKYSILVPILAQITLIEVSNEYINTYENYQKELNKLNHAIGLYKENL